MPDTTRFLWLLTVSMALLQVSCKEKKTGPSLATGKDTLLIYIMAGQSNMAGRGLIEPQDTVTNPRILTVDSLRRLVVAREPLHFYHPGFSGLDCGLSFATSLLPHIPPNSKICLVPCAMSSSSVQDWLGDSSRGVRLYSNMMERAQVAMQHGVLKGVLWHQGEANAEDSVRASRYQQDLTALVLQIRHDAGDDGLPFFAGTLADFCVRPFKDSINSAIRAVSHAVRNVYVVPLADLSGKPDGVHFDAAGQREMGRRFAATAEVALQP